MKARQFNLDIAKAMAMLLGVVLHASLAYMESPVDWPVRSTESSVLLGFFVGIIHAFRMPLFFLLAGYFAGQTFLRHGLKELIQRRLHRIFVPFFKHAL